jgi:iron complex outermembrane receptor protein
VLYERSKRKDEGDASLGVPPSLPPELKRGTPPPRAPEAPEPTIEDATNPTITSVSGRAEPLRAAPGKVLVLTGRELRDRGYTELSQIFDDLPGMEVVRPYGDTFFKVYWRGARTTSGLDPYLVTLDGLVFNHLFFRNTQILSTFPLTSIERIEIVYNPATAAALPGSALGAINIVTKDGKARQEHKELGTWLSSRQTFGTHQSNLFRWDDSTKQIDASLLHVSGSYRLRLTARVESGAFERAAGERYEYTRDRYYSDPRLWPENLRATHPGMAGRFFSPIDKRAFDGRLYVGKFEVALQHFSLHTGLGTHFPGDRQQSAMPWRTSEFNLYGRHVAPLSSDATFTSLVQYRESDITPPTAILSLDPGTRLPDPSGPSSLRPLGLAVPSSAVILQEDLDLTLARDLFYEKDALSFVSGFRFQRQRLSANLTNLAAISFSTSEPEAPAAGIDLVAVTRSSRSFQYIDDLGAYGQIKYATASGRNVHLGARVDRNSLVGSSLLSLRGGYAGTSGPLTTKLLFSEGVNTPGPFDVIFAGQTSAAQVKPERLRTLTGHLSAAFPHVAFLSDLYLIDSRDVLLQGVNLRRRLTAGTDLGVQAAISSFRAWAYYSRLFLAKRTREGGDQLLPEGDLAANKAWGGLSYGFSPVTATVLGRFIGERRTVETNPVPVVPAFFVLDANVNVTPFFYDALSLGFRVANVLGARYAHPGVDEANAGVTPAAFTAGTGYRGSAGRYSSLHPQPGRSFFLTLGLDL